MFIQTEATPNPATLKFLPGRDVLGEGGAMDFPDADAARRSPLAAALFEIPQVGGVFLGADFVTVTKTTGEWRHLKPAVLGVIMEHFTRGLPVLAEGETAEGDDAHGDEGDPQLVAEIKELLDTRIRPAVAQDGGDIIFRRFDAESGTVYLKLRGACAGCPSSTATLKMGIENMLRHYVPEVQRVEAAG